MPISAMCSTCKLMIMARLFEDLNLHILTLNSGYMRPPPKKQKCFCRPVIMFKRPEAEFFFHLRDERIAT